MASEKRFLEITQNMRGAIEMDKEMVGVNFKIVLAIFMKETLRMDNIMEKGS